MSILFVKRYGQLIVIVAVLGLYIFTKMQLAVSQSNLKASQSQLEQCNTVKELQNQGILQLKKEEQLQAAKLAQAQKLADESAQKAAKALELETAIDYGRTCEEAFKKGVERALILQEKER